MIGRSYGRAPILPLIIKKVRMIRSFLVYLELCFKIHLSIDCVYVFVWIYVSHKHLPQHVSRDQRTTRGNWLLH